MDLRASIPQEIDVPAGHSLNELNCHARTLDAGVLEGLQCSAAVKPRFTLEVLVVKSHLLLEDLLKPRHRRFSKRILRDQLNSFNTQNPAYVWKPDTIFRRDWINEVVCFTDTVG